MAYDPTLPATLSPASSSEMRTQLVALSRRAPTNLFADPTMLIWAGGDAAAPSYYTLSGGTSTIARVGVGHATDTKQKEGPYSAKVTAVGATAQLMQSMVPTTPFALSTIAGGYFGLGAWVWATVAATARLKIDDGTGTPLYSAYHTGGAGLGGWEWLGVSGRISVSATKLAMGGNVVSGGVGWFSGFTGLQGDVTPDRFVPPVSFVGDLNFGFNGPVAVTSNRGRKVFQRPALIKNVLLDIETAPTGAALIVDVLKWDGSGWLSMFQSSGVMPQIAAAGFNGQAQPNNTAFADYHRRCFTGYPLTSSRANSRIRYDVTQVGSSVAGSDLTTSVQVLQFPYAWEFLLSHAGA